MATEGIAVESRDIPETDPAAFTGTPTPIEEPEKPEPAPKADQPDKADKPAKEYVREGRRFVAKDTPKTDEPATDPAADPAEEPPAEAAEGPAGAEAAPVAEEPDAAIVPYTFKAYGQEIAFPGAQYKPGHGVFLPEDSLTAFRVAVARAIKHDKLVQDNESLRTELKRGTTQKDLEAQAVMDVVLPKLTSDEWLQAFVQNPELARKELALELRSRQLEVQQRLLTDPAFRATDPSLLEAKTSPEDVTHELDVTVDELLRRDEFKGAFTRAERADLAQAIADRQGAYVVPAPQDIPEINVRKGEPVIDQHALYRDLQREASARQQIRAAIKPSSVAKQNAQRTQATIAAPPAAVATPAAKAGKAKSGEKRSASEPRWKSRAEYQAWLESDEL